MVSRRVKSARGELEQIFGSDIAARLERFLRSQPGPPGQVGAAGPPGPSGSGGTLVLQKVAVGIVSGHLAVKSAGAMGVVPCSAIVTTDAPCFLGVTRGAALSGGAVEVIAEGELTEPTWSWTPNRPVFLGANGVLTQAYDPSWAFSLAIGLATSPTSLYVRPLAPITLQG